MNFILLLKFLIKTYSIVAQFNYHNLDNPFEVCKNLLLDSKSFDQKNSRCILQSNKNFNASKPVMQRKYVKFIAATKENC